MNLFSASLTLRMQLRSNERRMRNASLLGRFDDDSSVCGEAAASSSGSSLSVRKRIARSDLSLMTISSADSRADMKRLM